MSRSYQLWKNDVEVIIIFLLSLLLLWKTGIFWTLNKFLSTTLCWMALKGWYSKSAFNFWSNDILYVYVNWKMKAPYFFHKKVPVVPWEGPRSSNLVLCMFCLCFGLIKRRFSSSPQTQVAHEWVASSGNNLGDM